MSIVARPERQRDLGDDPRAVRDEHAQLVHLAAGEVGLEQPPAVVAGGVVPLARCRRRRRAASWSRTRRQPRDHVVDRGHQRVGVGAVDAAPDRPSSRPPRG